MHRAANRTPIENSRKEITSKDRQAQRKARQGVLDSRKEPLHKNKRLTPVHKVANKTPTGEKHRERISKDKANLLSKVMNNAQQF
jgi:hypothetical protein